MNIIFLDVDGVLNSIAKSDNTVGRPYSGYDYPFNSTCLNNLKMLVEKTNAYLVITSTWRCDQIGRSILLSELKKYKLDNRVIGYTDILHQPIREEVKAFLDILDENINYVILNDESDFPELEEHLIRTNYENGLTEENIDVAIKMLNKCNENVK